MLVLGPAPENTTMKRALVRVLIRFYKSYLSTSVPSVPSRPSLGEGGFASLPPDPPG